MTAARGLNKKLQKYWLIDHPLGAFELFGAAHLAVLALVAAGAAAMLAFGRDRTDLTKKRLRAAFVTILVVNELLWHVWAFSTEQYLLKRMLPLHLCSLMVWVTVIALTTNNRRFFGLLYFLGVAGAAQALITPDAGPFGFPHFRFLQTMVSHAGVFLAGIYVVAVEAYRPTRATVWKVFAGLNVYALIVWIVNGLIGSNYLFVSGKPESASLLDFMPPWPWYLLILEGLALTLFFLLWLPFRTESGKQELPGQRRLRADG